MSQSFAAVHCINPDCPQPYPQPWGSNFCCHCGTPLRLNHRYFPLQLLGIGGFAAIYRLYDQQTQTERVLKVLLETSPKALELFEQEATVLANLRHPGIPQVEADGYFQVRLGQVSQRVLPCLVMEKIDGETLQDLSDRHPQGCPEAWVLEWLMQAVDILQVLHQRQIIHRDLKPANFMLRRETQRLVVIDFGGAKQIGSGQSSHASSTRLVSPGYSPPEQISGSPVGPTADFYALGRTCIHLLTGQYPADLEDPQTGELWWRNRTAVSREFADLLDDLTRREATQRPANANKLQTRLAKIAPNRTLVVSPGLPAVLSKQVTHLVRTGWDSTLAQLADLSQDIGSTLRVIYQALSWSVRACLDTAWETVLGGLSGAIGSALGFLLAYWLPVGTKLAGLLTQGLTQLIPDLVISVRVEVVLFGFAGWATGWGLSEAGGLGQRKRAFIAGAVGLIGYELGWLSWQVLAVQGTLESMTGFAAIAPAFLVLGLGLTSHHFAHALVVAIGTSSTLSTLFNLNLFPIDAFLEMLQATSPEVARPGWSILSQVILFFGVVGAAQAISLGISYYLIVPILRFLGWR